MLKQSIKYIMTVMLIFSVAAAPASEVVNVIVNKSNNSKQLSTQELVDIFTRRKSYWNDGSEIVVMTRPVNSIPHKAFISEVLGLTPYEYRSKLERNIYQGRTKLPVELKSEEELADSVINNPTAVGYIYDYMIIKHNKRITIVDVKK